jgi:hypothetical protein
MPHPEPERREHPPPGRSLLAGLSPEQAQAVTHGGGPLLLIAGPGAGKTRNPYPPDRGLSAKVRIVHGSMSCPHPS